MIYNIKAILDICLERNINVQVFHGKNTSGQWRSAAVIELDKAVRVDFGDKAHGQRISRVHIANDHKVVIKIPDLIEALENYESNSRWSVGSITNAEPV
jgi:hypothetical protein